MRKMEAGPLFIFGRVVEGEDFVDRRMEQETLVRELSQSRRVFLVSPRRYGKSSLLKAVLSILREKGILTAYVDLFRVHSLQEMLEYTAQEVLRAAESTVEGFFRWIQELLPRVRPVIRPPGHGEELPALTFEVEDVRRNLREYQEDVWSLPQRFAQRRRRRLVVAFDEFQKIREFDGKKVEETIRSYIQHHDKVGYVFAGSEPSVIQDMVANPQGAFYKFGRRLPLGPLPRAEFVPHLVSRFRKGGVAPAPGSVEAGLGFVRDVPDDAQRLSNELWIVGLERDGRVSPEDLPLAIERIVRENDRVYVEMWEHLPRSQRDLLRAIAKERKAQVYAAEFRRAHQLGGASSVQRSIGMLVKRHHIGRDGKNYRIEDVFFEEWIRRCT